MYQWRAALILKWAPNMSVLVTKMATWHSSVSMCSLKAYIKVHIPESVQNFFNHPYSFVRRDNGRKTPEHFNILVIMVLSLENWSGGPIFTGKIGPPLKILVLLWTNFP